MRRSCSRRFELLQANDFDFWWLIFLLYLRRSFSCRNKGTVISWVLKHLPKIWSSCWMVISDDLEKYFLNSWPSQSLLKELTMLNYSKYLLRLKDLLLKEKAMLLKILCQSTRERIAKKNTYKSLMIAKLEWEWVDKISLECFRL